MAHKKDNHMSICIRNGLIVYPIQKGNGKWYLRVDLHGKKKIVYDKVVSKSTTLRGKDIEEKVEKVYEYWYNKIIK